MQTEFWFCASCGMEAIRCVLRPASSLHLKVGLTPVKLRIIEADLFRNDRLCRLLHVFLIKEK
jgi:hypothetical protein